MKKLAITSMYANPIHPGHIECLELAKSEIAVDELWVIINNDLQAELKRGVKSFQDENFRMKIVASLKPVDKVFLSIDTDLTVRLTLIQLIEYARKSGNFREIVFIKGGDRYAHEIPEAEVLKENNIPIIDGLGNKIHHSSDFVNNLLIGRVNVYDEIDKQSLFNKINNLPDKIKESTYLEVGNRPWGLYYVLDESISFKIKKIIVEPNQRLSLQSHQHRSEHWTVVQGTALIDVREPKFKQIKQEKVLSLNQSVYVPIGWIHRLTNIGAEPLVIIEVQCGTYLGEDDIIRYEDDYSRT